MRHGGPEVKEICRVNRAKNRSYLMGVVGGYVLYLAYQMFRDRNDPSSMSMGLKIFFVVFFAVAGIALVIYAFRIWLIADRKEREGKEEAPPEDENTMK